MSRGTKRGDIAIVGMACRFPGLAASPAEFWRLLAEGRDAVTEVDDGRWSKAYYHHPDPKRRGRAYTWAAGVLEDIDRFDAAFFGISPREAAQMDPQQRMLLEMVWEALEDAGQPPQRLAGTGCGVYVGVSGTDYANSRIDDPASGDAYVMTGGTLSIAANRISYLFDLRGPSMAIDTACSSSLVALHQACQALWRGEAETAITGGINLLMTPFNFIGFAKASMLSPRGRCRAFDATGDGYVRSEGGAVLFLKPLARARADGDPVHAVIAATGVNSDGRTKGLSMPSSAAQEALLRRVYGEAGIDPRHVVYLEAHGTGTAAGDPQEAGAIGRALGQARAPGDRLPIGSVKTNIGHLEPASGLAGLVKAVLALEHREIPRTLHFERPNPDIAFADLNLEVVTEHRPLPETGAPGLVGVNSFGFGGTNAHVVLKEHRGPARRGARRRTAPLLLSARDEGALAETARAYRDLLLSDEAPPLYDVAHSAATRREHHPLRLAAWGPDAASVASALGEFANEGSSPRVVSGRAIGDGVPVAFLFSGNGCQWPGMARRLLRRNATFRRAVAAFDARFEPLGGFATAEVLRGPPARAGLERTEVAQPVLLAVQIGLVEVLRERGVEAEYVLGHSVGEVAAAWAAGIYDLHRAARVIFERSRAQGVTRGQGRMAAVGLGEARAREAIAPWGEAIEIAACNSPGSVTLSGPVEALEALGRTVEAGGGFYRLLDLDYAFHSRAMDPIEEDLVTALDGLEPEPGRLTMISTVTGEAVDGASLGARYWWDNVRAPVRLDRALESLLADGPRVVVEIGPQPIMQAYLREAFRSAPHPGAALPTLRRDADDEDAVAAAVYGCHVHGAAVDRSRWFPVKAPAVRLPTYPWQRESYWYESTDEGLGLLGPRFEHPLLGYRLPRVDGIWENHLDTLRLPFLADHVVGGAPVFPAAGFAEMALAASVLLDPDAESHVVEQLEIRAPLVLSAEDTRLVRFTLAEDRGFRVASRTRLAPEEPWTLHAVGRLAGTSARRAPAPLDLRSSWSRRREHVAPELHYRRAAAVGLEYGPAFQAVDEVRPASGDTVARLRVPEAIRGDLADYHLHPSLLDACLQTLVDALADGADPGLAPELGFLPFSLGRLTLRSPGARVANCRTVITRRSPRSILATFHLLDDRGRVVAEVEDFRFRRMRLAGGARERSALYRFRALLAPRVEDQGQGLLPAPRDLAEGMVEELTEQWYALRRAEHYGEVLPLFDALAAAYARRAVAALGGERGPFTVEGLGRAAGVDADRLPWLHRLLHMLEEDGLASREGLYWRLGEAEELADPDEIWRALVADFPAYLPEIVLAGRCGLHLVELLKGDVDPGAVLGAGEDDAFGGALLETSPAIRITTHAARDAIGAIAADWPENRRLRVLEVGLGATGLAAEAAALLPPERGDYVLACPPARVARAMAELEDRGEIRVQALDAGADPAEQGFTPGAFDVLLVNHALHTVDNPRAVLAGLRRLLVTDGLLLALERPAERLNDLVFGADRGWWARSRGPSRPLSKLREPEEWQRLAEETGFADLVSLSEPAPDVTASSYLLIGRNPDPIEPAPRADGEPARRYLLVHDAAGTGADLAERVARALGERGFEVVRACPEPGTPGAIAFDPASAQGWRRLLGEAPARDGGELDVVHLLGLELHAPAGEEDDPVGLQRRRCLPVLALANAMGDRPQAPGARVWLVTSGAAPFEDGPPVAPNPGQAPLWGLGRVLENEHADVRWRLLDVAADGDPTLAARLVAAEIGAAPDAETEVVRTAQARYALRAERTSLARPEAAPAADRAPGARLDFATPGPLGNLRWQPETPRPPGPGEIQIAVRATGLNFRDVMYAMGMLSDEAVENGFAGPTLGMECAGDVVAVGPDVTGFEPGDPVVCFARACFATHVTTATTAVAHKPSAWSYAEAATVPSVFFTVYYALHHLARLQPGERILIHGAAGGVGLAAIQYARYCGAEIFATAGSPEKRDFLGLLGVDHILDSRRLSFADEILDITRGEGIDVVLNSLSGEAVQKNLAVLRPFGRFLELGKRDFYENAKVGLRPFRNNITYYGIDADQLLVERSDLAGGLFREMMSLFEHGAFRPLVHRAFPCARAADAFRHMQQSRHLGKVVITYEDPPPAAAPRAEPAGELELDAEACYLVTGGFGGFGLATARWLVEKGARHLALLGRSGAASDEARAAVEALEAQGASVLRLAVDVADERALARALAPFGRTLPPIRGVIHAAMVLDDGLVRGLDPERFEAVLLPKVRGAWNLHRQCRNLDFMVLYSSATTTFGNPGQASYVAANLYLEALAAYRRARGLPALAVSWGPIGDAGYLARNEQVRDALAGRTGGRPLTARAALEWLERLLVADRSGLAVADLDWRALRRGLPAARHAKFERLLSGVEAGDGEGGEDIQSLIADLSDEEIQTLITEMLTEQVAKVLRTSAERLDPDQSIYDLGMDSLMAVELHMAIEERFGISVPIVAVTEGAGIGKIAARIAAQLATGQPETAAPQATVARLAARHGEELSAEELESLSREAQTESRRLLP